MAVIDITKIDIKTISPTLEFILDANVLVYVHFDSYTSVPSAKAVSYSSFVSKLLANGNKIFVATISLQEFLNVLEKKFYELYVSQNSYSSVYGKSNYFSRKAFRRVPAERIRVLKNLKASLYEVMAVYQYIEEPMLLNEIEHFTDANSSNQYDPIDFLLVGQGKGRKIENFITDDTDFAYDPTVNTYKI